MASTTDEPIEPAEPVEVGEPAEVGAAVDAPTTDAGAGETSSAEVAFEPEHAGDFLEREGEAAADYLEGLLDIIDVDGDIDMDVDGDRAVVSVIGDRLRHLVGPGGAVLDSLQELTRLAVARETGVRSRLMLDVGGYRAHRRAELTTIGAQAAERAIASGEPVALGPMSAFERKVVHDAVAAAGLRSESEGVDPERHVIVVPARRQTAAASDGGGVGDDPAIDPATSPQDASTDQSGEAADALGES